jgi:hypothetical protein
MEGSGRWVAEEPQAASQFPRGRDREARAGEVLEREMDL